MLNQGTEALKLNYLRQYIYIFFSVHSPTWSNDGKQRTGEHPGKIHDLPPCLYATHVPAAAHEVPRALGPATRGMYKNR